MEHYLNLLIPSNIKLTRSIYAPVALGESIDSIRFYEGL